MHTHEYIFNNIQERKGSEKGQHEPASEVKWTTCVLASFVHVVETEGEEGDTVMVERGDVIFSFSTCCCFLFSAFTLI